MFRFTTTFLLLLSSVSGGHAENAGLGWLVGCWISGDQSSREVWVSEGADRLAGFGITVRDNTVVFHEVLTIMRGDDARWVYTAYPAGQAATSFVAARLEDQQVVFVNPDHDYPQEIRYSRDGSLLHAVISLTDGKNPMSFTKAACPAGS